MVPYGCLPGASHMLLSVASNSEVAITEIVC